MAYHEYKDDDLIDPVLAEELEGEEDEKEAGEDEEVLEGDKEWGL